MANIAKQFELIINTELVKSFTRSQIIKAANAAGNAAINAIRERTSAGIDYENKRLPKLTKLYSFNKKKGIALKNYKKYDKQFGKKTSKFAAKGSPNHGRLSGMLFSSMFSKTKLTEIKKNYIRQIISLDIKEPHAKKIEWLESSEGGTRLWGRLKTPRKYSKQPRKIWGLSKTGRWKEKEKEMIKDAYSKAFAKNANIRMRVLK